MAQDFYVNLEELAGILGKFRVSCLELNDVTNNLTKAKNLIEDNWNGAQAQFHIDTTSLNNNMLAETKVHIHDGVAALAGLHGDITESEKNRFKVMMDQGGKNSLSAWMSQPI